MSDSRKWIDRPPVPGRDAVVEAAWGALQGSTALSAKNIRAIIDAVCPLLADQITAQIQRDREDEEVSIRADERAKVAEEIAAELNEWADRQQAQAAMCWNPQTKRHLESYAAAYATAAQLAARHKVPAAKEATDA